MMEQQQRQQEQLQQTQPTSNNKYSISTLLISKKRRSRIIKSTYNFSNLYSVLLLLLLFLIFFIDNISNHIFVWKKQEQTTTKSITTSTSTGTVYLCTAFIVSSIDYNSIVSSNKPLLSNNQKNNENNFKNYNIPFKKRLISPLASSSESESSLESEGTSTTGMTTVSSSSTTMTDTTKTTITTIPTTKDVKVLGICGGIGSGKSTVCQILVNEFGCLAHIDADKVAHSVYAPGSEGVQAIVNQFGTTVLVKNDDNTNRIKVPYEIHRPSLGAIVFSNNDCMKQLEQIVWPRTKELIQQQIQQIKETYCNELNSTNNNNSITEKPVATGTTTATATIRKRPIIIVEAAMLLDANWYNNNNNNNNENDGILDGTWIVTVPEHIAIERLVQNRNLSINEANKRYTAQLHRRGINNLYEEVHTIESITGVITNDSNDVALDSLKQQLEVLLLNDNTIWYK